MQLFISSHQFSCQLTIHPPLLRSSPGFGPANEATTTLLCPDEVVAGFLCVCVAFWAEIAWSSLACNHDFYYLTVFRGHLDGFPTKMKVICFSVRTLSLISLLRILRSIHFFCQKFASARNLGPLRWTLREMDKKHQDIYGQAPSQSLSIKFSTYSRYTYPYPCHICWQTTP